MELCFGISWDYLELGSEASVLGVVLRVSKVQLQMSKTI